MDQIIQAVGLGQGQAIPGAPPSITGQELLLRALGAALPPPGRLRVPDTGVGRTAGTLARIGAGLAGAKAEDLQRLRLDPLTRKIALGETALEAAQGVRVGQDPTLSSGETRGELLGRLAIDAPQLTAGLQQQAPLERPPRTRQEFFANAPEAVRTQVLRARAAGLPILPDVLQEREMARLDQAAHRLAGQES